MLKAILKEIKRAEKANKDSQSEYEKQLKEQLQRSRADRRKRDKFLKEINAKDLPAELYAV